MKKKSWMIALLAFVLMISTACSEDSGKETEEKDEKPGTKTEEAGTIKIGVLASLTGALESYGKQTKQGFELGLEYATDGTMEVAGKKIEVVFEDTETKPEVAVQKATKLLEDDKVISLSVLLVQEIHSQFFR